MTPQRKTILVIDDTDSIRASIQQVLELHGYLVTLAVHGRDGLETLRKMKLPSVVLLDIQMPEMDGYEFLEEKNKDPALAGIPVVVVSATADKKNLKGAAGFVKKPFLIPDLIAAVERCCST